MRTPIQRGGALSALTSIRFFAALTVALSHFTQLGLLNLPTAFLSFVDGGRPAVSLFFVLSGFILTYTYHGSLNVDGASRFYVARFARIYPVMLLSLLIAMPVSIYVLRTGNDALLLGWYSLKSHAYEPLLASLVAQLFLLTGWFPFATINQPWNGPAWSISCEAFFYAIFPWLLRKLGAKSLGKVALICAAVWILQGIWILFVAHYMPIARKGFVISQFPLTHLSEFVMGVGSGLYFIRARAIGHASHGFGVMLISISLVAISLLAVYQPVKPAYYLESPFFAALITGLALLERPVLGLLNARALVMLGEASFSLYLIHIPLAHMMQIAGLSPDRGWVALMIVVGASILVFHQFEEPLRKWIRYGIVSKRPEPASAASRSA